MSKSYFLLHSNGNHSVTEWTLNVLKRNKNSCFNQNHLHMETRSAGSGYSLKCNTVTRNTGGNVTWYKVIIVEKNVAYISSNRIETLGVQQKPNV